MVGDEVLFVTDPPALEQPSRTPGARPSWAHPAGVLQLGELGAGERYPPVIRTEVHEHGVVFHAEDQAEPVLVVRDLIVHGERLGRRRRSRRGERAAGQVAPGRGAW